MEVNNRGWVLAKLVGGPRNGSVLEIGLDAMDRVLNELSRPATPAGGVYALSSTSAEADAGFALPITDERAAIARLGRGSPEFCIRLFWTEPDNISAAGDNRNPAATGHPADLLESLLTGNQAAARAIAQRANEFASGPSELVDAHLAPALREIGHRWQSGQLGIYYEKRAVSIVRRILAETPISPWLRSRGRAVTAVLSGDPHGMPSEMATHALRDIGWEVESLGINTPPEALLSDLDPADVDLIVLSPTMAANQALSLSTAATLRERGVPVLVGAPGLALAELQQQAAG